MLRQNTKFDFKKPRACSISTTEKKIAKTIVTQRALTNIDGKETMTKSAVRTNGEPKQKLAEGALNGTARH